MTDMWSLFDRLAAGYDEVIPFFGCGRGALAVAAAVRGCVVTAVDAAP